MYLFCFIYCFTRQSTVEVMSGRLVLKRTSSDKSNKQKSLFAIKRKSTSRNFRLCVRRPLIPYIRQFYFIFNRKQLFSPEKKIAKRTDSNTTSCSRCCVCRLSPCFEKKKKKKKKKRPCVSNKPLYRKNTDRVIQLTYRPESVGPIHVHDIQRKIDFHIFSHMFG